MRNAAIAIFACLFGLIGTAKQTSSATSPVMRGNWEIAICDDLVRTTCQTAGCYSFTKVAGSFTGVSNAGTFIQNGLPGGTVYTGKWLQIGNRVTLWASRTFGGLTVINIFDGAFFSTTELNGEGFLGYALTNPANVELGSWRATKVGSC